MGPSFQGTTLRYLFNPFYGTANNASTLGLAEEFLKGGGLIVEGDVVWGETFQRALQKGLESSSQPITWAALPFLDGMDGSLLVSDHSLKVHSMEFRRIGAPLPGGDLWKSSGLVSLSSQGSLAFFPLLLKEDPERTPKYYDLVFQENLSALPIQLLPIYGEGSEARRAYSQRLLFHPGEGTENYLRLIDEILADLHG